MSALCVARIYPVMPAGIKLPTASPTELSRRRLQNPPSVATPAPTTHPSELRRVASKLDNGYQRVMRKVIFVLALVAAASVVRGFAAETFKVIHVGDLDALLRQHAANLWIYDANPPSTRAREGVIPGAHLLSSSSDYEVAKDLPPAKDAKLVFYCANTH
jgi:hypothetical protein